MIEQDVQELKQMYLPVMFNKTEMSGLWQMLKGWIKKASPGLKAKWGAIDKLQGSHAAKKVFRRWQVSTLQWCGNMTGKSMHWLLV